MTSNIFHTLFRLFAVFLQLFVCSAKMSVVLEKLTIKNNICCTVQTCWISGLRRLPDAAVWGGVGPHQHCQRQLGADAGRRQRRGRSALHQIAALSRGKRLRAGCLGHRWVKSRAADSDLGRWKSVIYKMLDSSLEPLRLMLVFFCTVFCKRRKQRFRFPSVKWFLVIIKATGKCFIFVTICGSVCHGSGSSFLQWYLRWEKIKFCYCLWRV